MNSTSRSLHPIALALCLSASCAFAAEWTGTMSCGELQNAPNAKSKEPFSGKVTLRVEGSRAVLDRVWKSGSERLEGTVAKGRPLQLVGTGAFSATPDKPWKVRASLTQRGDRYEGPGVIESPDGTRKFRDCSIELTSVDTATGAKAETQPMAPVQPTAAEAPTPVPKSAAVAPAPTPAPREAVKEPRPPAGTDGSSSSYGPASLVLVFVLGAVAAALLMTMIRREGAARVDAPPAATAAQAGRDKRMGLMETLQGLLGLVVLVALVYWGYNRLFVPSPPSTPPYPVSGGATPAPVAGTSPAAQILESASSAIAASPPDGRLTPEERAIAERIKAKPTDRELVRMVGGQEIYPGVDMHYVLDQFNENPRCLVEFHGTMADGRPTPARRFFLVYTVDSKGLKTVTTESFFGPPHPLRLSVDQSPEYVSMQVQSNGAAGAVVNASLASRLSQARTVKVLNGRDASGEMSFTYDFADFGHASNIAMALCGSK